MPPELTPEEPQNVDAEEKGRAKAREQEIRERKVIAFFWVFGIAFLIIWIAPGGGDSRPQPSVEPRPEYFVKGDVGLTVQGSSLAIDDPTWDAMMESMTTNDEAGYQALVESGRVFMVEKGRTVEVLDVAFTSLRVQVLDGPHTGKTGWIINDNVNK